MATWRLSAVSSLRTLGTEMILDVATEFVTWQNPCPPTKYISLQQSDSPIHTVGPYFRSWQFAAWVATSPLNPTPQVKYCATPCTFSSLALWSPPLQQQHLPPSPPPSPFPGPLPGIGLDVSRVLDSDVKDGNAGTIRRRANAALEKLGVTCLGVNSKGNGRFRLLFRESDVDKDTLRQGNAIWGAVVPLRVDRAHCGVATDDIGCAVFGRMNGVKVHKMRWLGTASVDKEYRSLVVHLDKKEEVDRLLAKRTVEMANGEDFNQRDATAATSTDTCIIAARRQLRSVDSAANRAILRRPAPPTFLSVQRAVEKEHTKLQILGARFTTDTLLTYILCLNLFFSAQTLYLYLWLPHSWQVDSSSNAAEESGLYLIRQAPELERDRSNEQETD
ncbi:DDE superfamily endonuclease [Hirsutella rhossiliensis]